jgi:hypothetical protein
MQWATGQAVMKTASDISVTGDRLAEANPRCVGSLRARLKPQRSVMGSDLNGTCLVGDLSGLVAGIPGFPSISVWYVAVGAPWFGQVRQRLWSPFDGSRFPSPWPPWHQILGHRPEQSPWSGQWGQICPYDESLAGPQTLRIDGSGLWHRVVTLTRLLFLGPSGYRAEMWGTARLCILVRFVRPSAPPVMEARGSHAKNRASMERVFCSNELVVYSASTVFNACAG